MEDRPPIRARARLTVRGLCHLVAIVALTIWSTTRWKPLAEVLRPLQLEEANRIVQDHLSKLDPQFSSDTYFVQAERGGEDGGWIIRFSDLTPGLPGRFQVAVTWDRKIRPIVARTTPSPASDPTPIH